MTHSESPSSSQPSGAGFEQFQFDDKIVQALAALELVSATEIQQLAIVQIAAGKDLLASAATGSGKTLAFVLPMVDAMLKQPSARSGCRGLIMVPTRELAEQICQQLKALAKFTHINFTQLTGGADFKQQAAWLRKNPEIIVATPGRLCDHLRRESTDLKDLEFWVLDEADRMLDMGFSEDIDTVQQHANSNRQTLLFSATLKHSKVKAIAEHLLNEPVSIELAAGTLVANEVRHEFVFTDDVKHKQKLLDKLLKSGEFKRVLVFTNTKTESNRLRGVLEYFGLKAGCLHGDMTQDQRTQILRAFRHRKVDVLVATDVAARGLDISGLDAVIHFDMARKPEDYIHRAGRTGRAGREGTSISLICAYDWNNKARAEHAVGSAFEKREVAGLTAKYKGPDKVKSSGKAAGKKRDDKASKTKSDKPKAKKRLRDQVNKGRPKRFGPASKKSDDGAEQRLGDGFSPLKRR